MYTVVIVDDELDSQIALKGFLNKFCPQVEVLAAYSNIVDCLQNIYTLQPDILLLDIHLSHGTGFDILNEIKDLNAKVIFVTAYDEHAIKAFRYGVENYLLKPINHLELQKAIGGAIEKIDAERELIELKLLIDKPEMKKIGVTFKNKLHIMSLQEIIRCEANGNYTSIYVQGKERMIVPKTIKKFEELLGLHGFLRTHQSHLVNAQFLKNLDRKNNVINLYDGTQIPISRKYKPRLLDVLKFKFI